MFRMSHFHFLFALKTTVVKEKHNNNDDWNIYDALFTRQLIRDRKRRSVEFVCHFWDTCYTLCCTMSL